MTKAVANSIGRRRALNAYCSSEELETALLFDRQRCMMLVEPLLANSRCDRGGGHASALLRPRYLAQVPRTLPVRFRRDILAGGSGGSRSIALLVAARKGTAGIGTAKSQA
jgi:hypothetical protein